MLSKYYAKCEILILAKYLYSCHSSNLIRVKIHANYLEGWQKADNIDISDFSVNDKTMIKRKSTSCKNFYKAKAYDKTCFKTFQVIFMFIVLEIQFAQNAI